MRTCWVPGAEPGLSLEILQDRLLLMLRDLSRALRRTRPRWKFRLLSWSTALPLCRSWARPWRGSGSLTWRTRTRIRLCGPRPCRGRPKTTAPRVPGGEAGPPGAEGPGRGPAVSAVGERGRVSAWRRGSRGWRPWRSGARLGGGGNTRGDRGASSPLSALACRLAGPREGAEVAPQGKAGIFHETIKFGDVRIHRAWRWGKVQGLAAAPEPRGQQRPWERGRDGCATGSCSPRN